MDARMREAVAFLASDELAGRWPGTPGEAAAADFIERELRAAGLKPHRQAFDYVRPDGERVVSAGNVIASIGGSRDRVIVIGAHYDHIGMGPRLSRSPFVRAVHNGADDNASGVAILIELARSLQRERKSLDARIVFVAFSGEEEGLFGSRAFVERGGVDPERIVAYLNLESVGRLDAAQPVVRVEGDVEALAPVLASVEAVGFERRTGGLGLEDGSDHWSFHRRGVRVLSFTTGITDDYHRPTDDADRLSYEGMARIHEHVLSVTRALAGMSVLRTPGPRAP